MKTVARNKRVRFDYDILEEVEAGIILSGQEVKSVRAGNADLKGAYISMVSGRPVLKNATIQPYASASKLDGYDPGNDRDLLMHKKEIGKLVGMAEEKGIAIVPIEFRAGRTIKVLLGVGRGRKRYDKRQRIKERDVSKRLKRGEEI